MFKQFHYFVKISLCFIFLVSCSNEKSSAISLQTTTESIAITSTQTKESTATLKPTITATKRPTISPTSTSARMKATIADLYEKQIISTTGGEYHKLDNFDQSWAQLFWYQWWETGYNPTDFVVEADVSWNSASKTANWGDSGCGFVFHENGQPDHFATFLLMNGYVESYRNYKGQMTRLPNGYAEKFNTPSDKAHMILVVENRNITVLVNGKKVVRFQDLKLNGGNLAFTLASGTNKDYGTHCTMRNVDLWILSEVSDDTLPSVIGYNTLGWVFSPG
jgi:hypothetical protein